ncbi:heparinase II/III domain-containing protein [Cognataquiflexum rubidum]|uniref:heparinase II/III domain-containing protein n=1 Tax=Cognataquiflexum rubidum TaxID=2922273 RepID=UPI001F13428B|nr:alginate lyase family protein [Cognataquiflexum rubidum]
MIFKIINRRFNSKAIPLIQKFNNIGRIIRTISHLKPIQVAYQLKYRLFKPKPLQEYALNDSAHYKPLSFLELDRVVDMLKLKENTYSFRFLNLTNCFIEEVDWNFEVYGKLWNYNLQYMDWLKQNSLSIQQSKDLAYSLYQKLWEGSLLLEPYPTSLRIMNGIRFLSANEDINLGQYIKAEANFLTKRIEYHLLANHLLENAFAVYMAGSFFINDQWIRLGEKILRKELNEQILEDGAHFELSPMYHQIIFFRVLEFLTYESPDTTLYSFVKEKALKMLSWLKTITFRNGEIPHFNDSTNSIAPSSSQLFHIAEKIGLKEETNHVLNESGYRKYENENFELIIDVHGISPTYQPGHAHADTFSFCLNHKNKPVIVDQGISTYNISERRKYERSTPAHNTLSINGNDSAEVWSGFRVGRKLAIKIKADKNNHLVAIHNGYRNLGIDIQRELRFSSNDLTFIDTVFNKKLKLEESHIILHLHPTVDLHIVSEFLYIINESLQLKFNPEVRVEEISYLFNDGFNKSINGKALKVTLKTNELITTFNSIP